MPCNHFLDLKCQRPVPVPVQKPQAWSGRMNDFLWRNVVQWPISWLVRLAFFKFEIAKFRDSFFFPEEEHVESSNWEQSSWASCLGFFDFSKKRGISESKSEISPGTDDCHSTSLESVLRGPLRRSGCNSGNVVQLRRRLTSWHIQFANSFRFFQWFKRSAMVFRISPVSLKCSPSVSISGKWSEWDLLLGM